MSNNNWLKSVAKTYIQLNENEDDPVSRRARDYPNENDMGGGPGGDVLGLNQLNRYMEREGIISHGFILPEHIDTHGSPFNEDGTINSNHRLVQISLERARQRLGRWNDPLDKFLPHIRIADRIVDGKQKGYIINVMDKPQSSPQPPLNEARKLKPTATDRANNRKIEREARKAHLLAANAITSLPGFKIHPKYPGYNNPEDPEHGSVMDNLADRAPGVTDTETAIRLVAPMHNIDPEAAIAALGSSAPMSPQDFMRAMRR